MGAPGAFYEFAKNNALATDGYCRAYSRAATGTVWGEGAGVVVLVHEVVDDLLDDLERVGDAATPEGVPDGIDLALHLTRDHGRQATCPD